MVNKKSFILYCDLIHTVEKLNNNDAGELFKHLLRYVNDQNPETDNPIVDIVFEPIKQAFKRDLKKWEQKSQGRSEAGMKSAGIKEFKKDLEEKLKISAFVNMSIDEMINEKSMCMKYMAENHGTYMFYFYEEWVNWYQQKLTNSTNVDFVKQTPTNSTDSVNDNDNVNDSVNVNDNVSVIDRKKPKFDFKKSMCMSGFDEILVTEFLKIRKAKRAVNSELALQNIISEIEKTGKPRNEVLEIIVKKQWKGFEAEWIKEEQSPPNSAPPPRTDAMAKNMELSHKLGLFDGKTHYEPYNEQNTIND